MFYYIRGGICAVFSCFFVIYIVVGLAATAGLAFAHDKNAPPPAFGLIFVFFGSFAVLCGWTWAGLQLYTGRCLAKRKNRMFCMVIAALSCLLIPYGTLLGVFTLIVLQRSSVEQLFEQPPLVK